LVIDKLESLAHSAVEVYIIAVRVLSCVLMTPRVPLAIIISSITLPYLLKDSLAFLIIYDGLINGCLSILLDKIDMDIFKYAAASDNLLNLTTSPVCMFLT
jgi:hypothetical protein